MEEFFRVFRQQKEELRKARAEQIEQAKLRKREENKRVALLKNSKAKHPSGWNFSVNVDWFHKVDSANPEDFKPFTKEEKNPQKLRQWYVVRSGELFSTIKVDSSARDDPQVSNNSKDVDKKPPWLAPSYSPGQTFSQPVADPSFSSLARERVKRLESRRRLALRKPWQ